MRRLRTFFGGIMSETPENTERVASNTIRINDSPDLRYVAGNILFECQHWPSMCSLGIEWIDPHMARSRKRTFSHVDCVTWTV